MPRPEPLLVQAPVRALDADGLAAALVGTLAFAVATVVLALNADALAAGGHQWWLWVACAGSAIGVLFLAYCLIRRVRRRRHGGLHPDAD
jgi:membrane protein implicated in regulation of membrane protease activity